MEEVKKTYYQIHKDRILAYKRDKYATDEKFREYKKNKCLDLYYKKKEENKKEIGFGYLIIKKNNE